MSIGNLAAGGRAKTPLAALVAQRLLAMGEQPAVLSRGYARRRPPDGVVVVRDRHGLRADVDRAGDEPMMLARSLHGASVLVCDDRYLAGRLAEHHFGATVHVLDDGFQHFQLWHDADLVALAPQDLTDSTFPGGRLRESIDAASQATAFVALEEAKLTDIAGGRPIFRVRRTLGRPQLDSSGETAALAADPVLALAGIANPAGFFEMLRAGGWKLAGERAFKDHHRYSTRDLESLVEAAMASGARAIVTTEKDMVRLRPFRPLPFPILTVPLRLEIAGEAGFDAWLDRILRRAREQPQ